MMPYIAMNQFQVDAAQATQFEERWRRRRSLLTDVPGFKTFQLLKGDETDGVVQYVSHSTWASKAAFIDWTHSESFVQAHRGEPLPEGMVKGPPQLACYDVIDLTTEGSD